MLRISTIILAIVALLAQAALVYLSLLSAMMCFDACPNHGVREPFARAFASLWWLFLPALATAAVTLYASIRWQRWRVASMLSALLDVFGIGLLALLLTIPFGPAGTTGISEDPWTLLARYWIWGLVIFPIVALWVAKTGKNPATR